MAYYVYVDNGLAVVAAVILVAGMQGKLAHIAATLYDGNMVRSKAHNICIRRPTCTSLFHR